MKEMKMSGKSLVEKAVAVSRLMQLSTTIGAAVEVTNSGEVYLITADNHRSKIGGSINEAITVFDMRNGSPSTKNHPIFIPKSA